MEEKRGHQQLEDLEVVCGCVFSFSCGSDRSYIRCLYLEACSKHVPKRLAASLQLDVPGSFSTNRFWSLPSGA